MGWFRNSAGAVLGVAFASAIVVTSLVDGSKNTITDEPKGDESKVQQWFRETTKSAVKSTSAAVEGIVEGVGSELERHDVNLEIPQLEQPINPEDKCKPNNGQKQLHSADCFKIEPN